MQGPSGCGKTALLHLLCGLRVISDGHLRLGGRDLALLSASERDRWRGRSIGLILQQPYLVPGLSVAENVVLARYCAGLPRDPGMVQGAFDSVGVGDLADRSIHALSQGQAQRVTVARAVVNAPLLILADKPASSLDDVHARSVFRLLQEPAARTQATLVVVTHDQRLRDLAPH